MTRRVQTRREEVKKVERTRVENKTGKKGLHGKENGEQNLKMTEEEN